MLKPDESLFDFSNAPGTYHFLLDIPPANRYFHISQAIRTKQQEEVIDLLKVKPARVVAVKSYSDLGPWDGIPTMVRHYRVARFLWKNYLPTAWIAGELFFAPLNYVSEQKVPTDKIFQVEPCDWGDVGYYAQHWKEWVEEVSLLTKRVTIPLKIERGLEGKFIILPISAQQRKKMEWLEIRMSASEEDLFSLVDREYLDRDIRSRILFATKVGENQIYRIPISSCLQWHYFPSEVYLSWSKASQKIQKISFIEGQ